MTNNILSRKETDLLRKELVILQKARGITRKKELELSQGYWRCRASLSKIAWAIIEHKTEVGRRRAKDCPAFKHETQSQKDGGLGVPFASCNGRIGRPYSYDETRLFLQCCSDCRLKYEEIQTKMLILRVSNEARRRIY